MAKNNKQNNKAKDYSLIQRVIRRNTSIVRKDIADWKEARVQAEKADAPRQNLLQALYKEIMLDALITSQIDLRIDKTQGANFVLKKDKKIDEQATDKLKDTGLWDKLVEYILESKFYNNSLIELNINDDDIDVSLVPREHIVPNQGLFYPDSYADESINYREVPEYKRFLLEFYPKQDDLGILNKAVPYVLMKRFAMSCWSELCEIFGIPPRVLKTNTTDPEMMDRAEQMMREIGNAAYFIIDTEEQFEFAKSSDSDGAIYHNLIATCDEQISLLILSAVLGQDTLNGNRSKEESSSKLLESLVKADHSFVEYAFNHIVLPALADTGVLPADLRLEISKELDLNKLWEMVQQASQYYDFNIDWIKDTFGIEVTGIKNNNYNYNTTERLKHSQSLHESNCSCCTEHDNNEEDNDSFFL